MTRLLTLVVLFYSAFCAPAFADLNSCVAEADRLRASGAIGPVRRGEMVRDCNFAANGRNVFTEEFWTYYIYIASEFEAGRLTEPQAKYLIAQKQTEVEAKARQAALQLLQAAPPAQPYQSFRQAPRAPVFTNCTRDPWGNVSCVTQ
jgi:hypothetical protein